MLCARTVATSPLRGAHRFATLRGAAAAADHIEVSEISWSELPLAVRDGDVLTWLGFEPAEQPDPPLLRWPQPARWPAGRQAGRHRAPRRLQRA